MTVDMILLSAILAGAVALFAWDIFPADKVSLLVLGALVLARLIEPHQAVAGFGNQATIAVACMLALSYGIERTGVLNVIAQRIVKAAGASENGVLLAIMVAVGFLSAFINNTAAVALFLPLTISVARQQGFSVSKLLMPMSFAAIFAGTCTLIGTSTNLLVSSEIQKRDLGWEIGMFDFTGMGLVLFAGGTIYMLLLGKRLIPSRRTGESLTEDFRLKTFVTDLKVQSESPLIGLTAPETRLGEKYKAQIIEILRGKQRLLASGPSATIQEGDDLLVSCDTGSLISIQRELKLAHKVLQLKDQDLQDQNISLMEAWIAPNSRLIESTLKEINFRQTYQATALAVRSHGRTIREKVGNYRFGYGDSLLIVAPREQLAWLHRSPDFLMMEEVQGETPRSDKMFLALAIFAALVFVASMDLLKVHEAALIAVAAMVVTGCIRLHELYSAISWQTLVMLACLIPLGSAMDNTGLAAAIAEQLTGTLQQWGPIAVLSGMYLLTSLLTSIMSNNATAVLMVPICLSVASQLGVSPQPFVFAVMFAASASFMTPVGYQTNVFIFAPGGYKFSDFFLVGAPLNLIFWILASVMIPVFWPF